MCDDEIQRGTLCNPVSDCGLSARVRRNYHVINKLRDTGCRVCPFLGVATSFVFAFFLFFLLSILTPLTRNVRVVMDGNTRRDRFSSDIDTQAKSESGGGGRGCQWATKCSRTNISNCGRPRESQHRLFSHTSILSREERRPQFF